MVQKDLTNILPFTCRCNATSKNWLQCEEDLNNSTPSSFHKLETTESSEICEEYVIWSKKLNDFSDISPKATAPTLYAKNEIKIEEPLFEDHFTMVSGNAINCSIAYDPFFNDFTAKQLEENSKKYGDEKQKVIRKRKMMSLLHDKQIFKDYMKEIEENDTQHNKEDNKYDVPLNSPLTNDYPNIPQDLSKLFFELPQNNNSNINDEHSKNSSENTNEEILITLERTKNKLAHILNKDSVLDPKIQSLYPNNYLETFNFKNKIPDENVSNNNSFCNTESSTIASSQLSTISHEKINTSEALLFQVHSLSSKMIQSEDLKVKIQANQEMQILIDELMANVIELQDTCIQIGTTISNHSSNPLISFTPIGDSEAVVSPIIEEILNKLFEDNLNLKPEYRSQTVGRVKLDYTDVNTNNISSCLSVGPSNSLNFKLIPMVKNLGTVNINSTLKTNVEHATGLLTAIYDEMCQFNPIPQPLSQENTCFETFDLDDNSVESLGIMRSYENVASDLAHNYLSGSRRSLDEMRETLCISNDFELPTTEYMSNHANSSHFSFDRFSLRKPNNCEQPKIENLNDDQKDSQFNFYIRSAPTKPHQTVNLSNETKDLQFGLREKVSRAEEKRDTQKILNEASKIPLPFTDDDDLEDEVDDDKPVDKNNVIKSEEKISLTNKPINNVSKIPVKNVIKNEETVSLTNMILDESSKIPLSDDEEEVDNDKHQEMEGNNKPCINKIYKNGFTKEETISLANMILDETSKIPLPLSDDYEEVDNDKHQKKEDNIKSLIKKNEHPIPLLNNVKDIQNEVTSAISSQIENKYITFESQPGTSKQGQSLLKARKSSTILLPRLPSIPSTEITCLSLEESNTIRTILRKDLSSSSSASNDNSSDPEGINLYNFSYLPDTSFAGTSTLLERKKSTTNFAAAMKNSNLVDDCLTESELDFYIKTNIRDFEESIQKTIDYNKTTLEMMNSSKLGTPEGSLTILSTISANLLPETERNENANSSIIEVQSSADQSNSQLLQNITKEGDEHLNLDLDMNSLENNAIALEEIADERNAGIDIKIYKDGVEKL